MLRATVALLGVLVLSAGAGAQAAPPCPPRDPAPIPPIARRPISKLSLARSRALVAGQAVDEDCDAASGDAALELTLAHLREAIRVEPANVGARAELVRVIADAVRQRPDPALAAWMGTLLVQLRDAGWAGCEECIAFLADNRHYVDGWQGPDAAAFWGSVAAGPPGELGAAARALLRWMLAGYEEPPVDERRAWADAARYLDDGPIRIVEGFNGSGADLPVPSVSTLTVKGKRGLKRWLDARGDRADMPGRGDTMWCTGRCCTMPFIDYGPHMHRFSGLCFDARLHLRKIATDSSGM